MEKLSLPPDQASYSATDGVDVLAVQLEGGASRYRKDVEGAAATVNVQWTTDAPGYQYLTAFKRVVKAQAFLINLYLDSPDLAEYTAHFVPGSFKLASQAGLTFVVAATLEVTPLVPDEDADMVLVLLYGDDGALLALEDLVNVHLPEMA